MNITLKYFSWIRVKLKKSHDLIELNQTISFKELKNNLISKDVIYQEIFEDKSGKFFLDLKEIDDENQTLNNGDVLAVYLPLQVDND